MHQEVKDELRIRLALAAFFEEEGEIAGLTAAIRAAADRDTQWSDGKALSGTAELNR